MSNTLIFSHFPRKWLSLHQR